MDAPGRMRRGCDQRRLAARLPGNSTSSGRQGLPWRSSMYARIRRRTTCEGVASSSAQSRSKTAFLRGSIRIVSRAVRSSSATRAREVVDVLHIEVTSYDNTMHMPGEYRRKAIEAPGGGAAAPTS